MVFIAIVWAVVYLVAQLCLTLCNFMDYSLPGSSVHGDSPSKKTGVVAMPSSRGPSQPRNQTGVSCIAGGFFTSWATREAHLERANLQHLGSRIRNTSDVKEELNADVPKPTQDYSSTDSDSSPPISSLYSFRNTRNCERVLYRLLYSRWESSSSYGADMRKI